MTTTSAAFQLFSKRCLSKGNIQKLNNTEKQLLGEKYFPMHFEICEESLIMKRILEKSCSMTTQTHRCKSTHASIHSWADDE